MMLMPVLFLQPSGCKKINEFMEMILHILNGIKQTHPQHLNQLLNHADSAPSHPRDLPHFPFFMWQTCCITTLQNNIETHREGRH